MLSWGELERVDAVHRILKGTERSAALGISWMEKA